MNCTAPWKIFSIDVVNAYTIDVNISGRICESIETGASSDVFDGAMNVLPSVLGNVFFRAPVTGPILFICAYCLSLLQCFPVLQMSNVKTATCVLSVLSLANVAFCFLAFLGGD